RAAPARASRGCAPPASKGRARARGRAGEDVARSALRRDGPVGPAVAHGPRASGLPSWTWRVGGDRARAPVDDTQPSALRPIDSVGSGVLARPNKGHAKTYARVGAEVRAEHLPAEREAVRLIQSKCARLPVRHAVRSVTRHFTVPRGSLDVS